MKTALKIIVLLLFFAFVGLQFFRSERTNPAVIGSETLQETMYVPKEVDQVLKRSCSDCHSNETVYPWYSNIAPISWKVVQHIDEGRDELNFSKWGTYGNQRKARKLEEICEEVEERNMPHNQYLWIHWDAALSDSDIKTLCDWTAQAVENLKKENSP